MIVGALETPVRWEQNMGCAPVVYVIDDESAFIESMGHLLRSAGYEAKLFRSAEDFFSDYDGDQPSCVLVDVLMPDVNGFQVQQRLRSAQSSPVVMMSGQADVPMAVRALQEGAFAFLEKPFQPEELLRQVARAVETDRQRIVRQQRIAELCDAFRALTPRERQVLEEVVDGKQTKKIANELQVSDRTVESHRRQIMRKLKCRSIAELVAMFIEYKNLCGDEDSCD